LLALAPSRRPKYASSPLDQDAKRRHAERLSRHMVLERPFLDPSLNLEGLARSLRILPSYLSQVLNEELGQNFYEYVSEFRVREVQARLCTSDCAERTLLALAFESGFNSKASFNRAFKRVTGMTPSEFARTRSSEGSPQSRERAVTSNAGVPLPSDG